MTAPKPRSHNLAMHTNGRGHDFAHIPYCNWELSSNIGLYGGCCQYKHVSHAYYLRCRFKSRKNKASISSLWRLQRVCGSGPSSNCLLVLKLLEVPDTAVSHGHSDIHNMFTTRILAPPLCIWLLIPVEPRLFSGRGPLVGTCQEHPVEI